MYSLKELRTEICAKIEWLKNNNGKTIHPDWITQAVLSDHQNIEGDDADFHICCTRIAIRKEATQQINKLESLNAIGSDKPQQLSLDGFEFLQQWYVVKRDDEYQGVQVDALTDEEIDRKASEYEAMGKACLRHADELRRYKEVRRVAA